MSKYPCLFSPIKIGNLTLKNRIEAAPISVNDHNLQLHLADNHIALYERRAAGGAAIVTLGEAYVDGKMGLAQECIALYDPKVIPSLIRVTDAIKSHGAIASIELNHGGIFSSPDLCGVDKIWGPSNQTFLGTEIIEMDEDMIASTVSAFGDAALHCKYGGFNMVMLHAGHGWLLSNFLSPLHNKRCDRFGGCIKNRVRIIEMIIDDIKSKCGHDFPVELRMSGDEFIEGGYDISEGVEIAKLLDSRVDLFHVSACHFADDLAGIRMFPSALHEHGCNVYLAAEIKKAVKTPVVAVGGLNTPEQMEEILASGKADIVALGRAISADPDFPEKSRLGNTNKIRTCIRCNYCLSSRYEPFIKHPSLVLSRCAINPEFGRELEVAMYKPSEKSQRVMIIGGGPGGMQAAVTASNRNHEVLLFEKSNRLGGLLNYATRPKFKMDLEKYKDYLIEEVTHSNVELYLNAKIDRSLVQKINPDVLLICVGANEMVPKIPGIDRDNVFMVSEISDAKIGEKVVIIGGGLTGFEEGVGLSQEGKDVVIIEKAEDVWSVGTYLQFQALENEAHKEKLELCYGLECKEIKPDGVIVMNKEGEEKFIPADTIIVAVGFKPNTELVDEFRSDEYRYHVFGNSLESSNLMSAVHSGFLIANNI